MEDSIFTKIIKGEIPCHKIYEDSRTLAFLDINPMKEAHTLVVTKAQVDQYIDLEDSDYQALWSTVKKVAARLRDVIGKDRVYISVKGTDVPHTHVHLVPFNNSDALFEVASQYQTTDIALREVADRLRLS